MTLSDNIPAKRFKIIREQQNHTQQAFAKALGIKGSTVDIERGKTKISGQVVSALLDVFKVNPLWLFGKSSLRYLDTRPQTGPKMVTVNSEKRENIALVNVKAAAGYPHNVQDVDWYNQLPAFDLPLPEFRNATFRGFQVEGDSMLPSLHPGEWIIGKAVPSLADLSENSIYVVILKDSVVVKKIQQMADSARLTLVSINKEYAPFGISVADVQEVWQVVCRLSFDIEANPSESAVLSDLQQSISTLKQQMANLGS